MYGQPWNEGTKLRRREDISLEHADGMRTDRCVMYFMDSYLWELVTDRLLQVVHKLDLMLFVRQLLYLQPWEGRIEPADRLKIHMYIEVWLVSISHWGTKCLICLA